MASIFFGPYASKRTVQAAQTTGGTGRLVVIVNASGQGRPATDARVVVTPSEEPDAAPVESGTTDSSGLASEIELPTPPREYSMSPGEPKPYSSYDVTISLDGYERYVVRGVQVFPDSEAWQEITLRALEDGEPEEEDISIPEPVLYGDYPPKVPEDDAKELPEETGFVVLPEPVIPEYIVVHEGVPTNASAQNRWIPFKDYIKNVASCEIYSNWPEETLKANVIAIVSFTLNRVYTEWYRAKGYSFTITNSTAFDHAFTYGRNIFTEIANVVDEIFTTYLTRPGIRQPLLAQYCDGRKSSCPQWMTQWGSKDLGDKGYTAANILKHFYGQDVYLTQAKQVSGVPVSFGGAVLSVGSSGADVRVIQEQLNAIANNYPLIKKIAVDGQYGESTRAAVQTFQQIFGMNQSGMVDFSTWYKISDKFVGVTRIAELR
ncbi:MAG: peptidoglycan-binding protein [Clostridiales bacterium]|jgi:hypothetical protein|nr:peptidoglycan-binding protein [Clostridiales bacterium]